MSLVGQSVESFSGGYLCERQAAGSGDKDEMAV